MTGQPPRPPGRLVVATSDPLVRRRLSEVARANGLEISEAAGDREQGDARPVVAVVDLERPGALDLVRGWRARWPGALIAGHLSVPDRERWIGAQRAGCDLVANRGSLVLRLRGLLAQAASPRGRRFPLFDAADVPGRLGLVFHTDDTPAGPVAVYQVAGCLHAIANRCPHAGAALSAGDVTGATVTCPRHGSQFDVRTGERLRGPADPDLSTFPLLQDGGQVFLLVPE
jgi:nitrite reductase/ring-hydroxylating ferredoxin subunit